MTAAGSLPGTALTCVQYRAGAEVPAAAPSCPGLARAGREPKPQSPNLFSQSAQSQPTTRLEIAQQLLLPAAMCSTWGRCRRSPRQGTAGPPREPTGLLCSLEMVHSMAQPSSSPHSAGSGSTAQHFASKQEAKLMVMHLPVRPSHFTHRAPPGPEAAWALLVALRLCAAAAVPLRAAWLSLLLLSPRGAQPQHAV